jgi:hypothetical protein
MANDIGRRRDKIIYSVVMWAMMSKRACQKQSTDDWSGMIARKSISSRIECYELELDPVDFCCRS